MLTNPRFELRFNNATRDIVALLELNPALAPHAPVLAPVLARIVGDDTMPISMPDDVYVEDNFTYYPDGYTEREINMFHDNTLVAHAYRYGGNPTCVLRQVFNSEDASFLQRVAGDLQHALEVGIDFGTKTLVVPVIMVSKIAVCAYPDGTATATWVNTLAELTEVLDNAGEGVEVTLHHNTESAMDRVLQVSGARR